MATRIPLALFISLSLVLPSALGKEVICEELPSELCAFAVSSAGKRCVVESYRRGWEKETAYQCRKSEVAVDRLVDWVETDDCVAACGADRRMVGISSDALLDQRFTDKLCSPECYYNCPNMIDLYDNLAAGEGVVLFHLCETRRTNPIRAIAELYSSGDAATAPAAFIYTAAEPTHSFAISGAENTAVTIPTPAPAPAPAATVAAISDDAANFHDNAGPAASISNTDSVPSDLSEFSIDPSSDELDADPIPVPALSPSTFFDTEPEDDADFD
ncbi:hypothetical protein IEQ34_013564 [Dendrobium chrysotoxum]|uniref:PAR1 protein n=1 Tax=Dendrobium chrysotoxum TaxID=161865 RepID=A0AAV7G8T3_DENCH|nr:hypothetical protein IEQ34_013564 [Dendrobium chrysotoxum]